MTPERAAELAERCRLHAGMCLTVSSQERAIADAILAACREERHAALTEAARKVDGMWSSEGPDISKALYAMRDKEQSK